ncbi:MAG: hypothetical protein HOY71_12760 [Nonomuraea sp.]|nr:hypothetical protein [Nonomuraea sp.]
MCDLNPQESRDIVNALTELNALAEQVATHTAAIETTAYMDHENLAAALETLRDRAETARAWVAAKPQQHSMH